VLIRGRWRQVLEDSVRHISHSFTVEVKRRRGRPVASEPPSLLSDAFAEAESPVAQDPGGAGAWFADHSVERVSPANPPPSAGRILPSLVENSPWLLAPEEAATPRRRRSTETPGSEPRQAARSSRFAHKDSRAAADPAPRQSPQGRSQERSDDDSSARSAVSKAIASRKARIRADKSPADERLSSLKADGETGQRLGASFAPIGVQSPGGVGAPSSIQADEHSSAARSRRKSILARYVFGTELKLGERWKKRLSKPR
jgi:hypothetical protein